jgi:aminoglycoside phosphotransferase (APT) family kinase protein
VAFVLTTETARAYLAERGLLPGSGEVVAEELGGGVSATVVAVRDPSTGAGLVVKQLLPRLRVRDEWRASPRRASTEADAMQACARLAPGSAPPLVARDDARHLLVMPLVVGSNWQAEVAEGRAHLDAAAWAGEVLGTWHRETAGDDRVAEAFDDHEMFAALRLDPFHATAASRLPGQATAILERAEELRTTRACLVHGDFAMKNILVGPGGRTVLDFEVAHYGAPVVDLAFFLSFVVLSAIRWPAVRADMEALAASFLGAYEATTGEAFAGSPADVVAHTACFVLARTDGKSIALFLDDASRDRARTVGTTLLGRPEEGLWSWA